MMRIAILASLCSGGIVGWLGYGLLARELAAWFPLKCPLFMLTGISCPTCGLGRALVAIWTGDYAAAWQFHPLSFVVYIVAFAYVVAPVRVERTFSL